MQPRKTPLYLLTLGLVACAPEAPSDDLPPTAVDDTVGEAASAIMGGYRDDGDPHAVAIATFGQNTFGSCSGTLISPNVVLTAQHCVAPSSGDGSVRCGSTTFGAPYDVGMFYVTTKVSLTNEISDYHRVREVHVVDGPDFCGNDVAVLILDDLVAAEEAQWVTPRVDEQLVPDEEYYAIGHGNTSEGSGGNPTRHRRDNLFTSCVGDACGLNSGVSPSEWRGDTGICSGDSGGGSYDLFNRVHGVASRGAAGCEYPIYGGVYLWGDWLKELTWYAANLAGIEPVPWATGFPTHPAYSEPVGAACEAASECPSNACLDGYCTRQCLEGTCPEGYLCNGDGWCMLEPEPEPPKNDDDEEEVTVGCSVSAPSQDPTKPIPWEILPLFGAALAFARRRRRA